MTTPDLTPAQIISTVLAVLGLLVTQGLITNHSEKVIGGLASILIPVGWQLADAIIRHGRSRSLAPSPVEVQPDPQPAKARRRPSTRPS